VPVFRAEGYPASKSSRPRSVVHPGPDPSWNCALASSTRLAKSVWYSFSGVPGVGSRRAQKSAIAFARSSSVFRALKALSSSGVRTSRTGPLRHEALGSSQDGEAARDAPPRDAKTKKMARGALPAAGLGANIFKGISRCGSIAAERAYASTIDTGLRDAR